MSADNYFMIRLHPNGGYAAVMGFASQEDAPAAGAADVQFETFDAALNWAFGEYSEYGVDVHPECTVDEAAGDVDEMIVWAANVIHSATACECAEGAHAEHIEAAAEIVDVAREDGAEAYGITLREAYAGVSEG